MKKESGLSMVALIIIVALVSAFIFIGVNYIKNYIEKEKQENIKTTMLLIQGKITEIANKHTVDEAENGLVGTKLNLESEEIEYNISEELKNVLINLENADLYVLSQEDLENLAVKDVQVNKDEFYIVDYNSEEVIYSLGINGKYKLTELENKKTEATEEQTNSEEKTTTEETPAQEEQPEDTPVQEEKVETPEQTETEIPA